MVYGNEYRRICSSRHFYYCALAVAAGGDARGDFRRAVRFSGDSIYVNDTDGYVAVSE